MPVERIFLGWDAPVPSLVVGYLTAPCQDGILDVADTLIVVPTRQAGRRLREALAADRAAAGGAALSVTTTTPASVGRRRGETASEALVVQAWADTLAAQDLAAFSALFPAPPKPLAFAWCAKVGGMLQRLREAVAENGLSLAGVPERLGGGSLADSERWQDLGRLESAYLARLESCGVMDPVAAQLADLRNPRFAEGVKRLVIACVPDPGGGLIEVLRHSPPTLRIDILVHAPQGMGLHFDEWGRPSPDYWTARENLVSEASAYLEATPREQAARVADIIARQDGGIADFAIGVPDAEVMVPLADMFAERGVGIHNPALKPLAEHPAARLVALVKDLSVHGRYADGAALLRHPSILSALAGRDISIAKALAQLDEISREHLPTSLGELNRFAQRGSRFLDLAEALGWLAENAVSPGEDIGAAMRSILEEAHRCYRVDANTPEGREWLAGAEAVADLVGQLEDLAADGLAGPPGQQWHILTELIARQTYSPPGEAAALDVEGWLELPWNPAPYVIVTGMNEGAIPDGRVDDPFLPDRVRGALGLRSDRSRLARDAFTLEALGHAHAGKFWVIAGKRSGDGEPLKPSRLLFRCPDSALIGRVRRFMGEAAESVRPVEPAAGFKLHLPQAAELAGWGARTEFARVSPSLLRDYLACPFRFFLKRVLKMEDKGVGEEQLDALGFGNLVHAVLEAFGNEPSLHECTAPDLINAFFKQALDAAFGEQYGSHAPFAAVLQLEAARERLAAAAEIQAKLAADGWRIQGPEISFNGMELLPGVVVAGRIDRLDRNVETGAWRVLDYKTSDAGKPPFDTHFETAADGHPDYRRVQPVRGGKTVERAWCDLQLPLYALAVREQQGTAAPVEAGYFNLPRRSRSASVELLPLSDALLASALACARGVVEDIRQRRFWPPARVRYDDFGRLFPLGIEAAVDPAHFDGTGVLL